MKFLLANLILIISIYSINSKTFVEFEACAKSNNCSSLACPNADLACVFYTNAYNTCVNNETSSLEICKKCMMPDD